MDESDDAGLVAKEANAVADLRNKQTLYDVTPHSTEFDVVGGSVTMSSSSDAESANSSSDDEDVGGDEFESMKSGIANAMAKVRGPRT